MNRPRRSRRLPKNPRRRNHIRIIARTDKLGLREGLLTRRSVGGKQIITQTVVVAIDEY